MLAGCATSDPDPAAVARGRDPGRYSGPLLGKHDLIASVEIPNSTDRPIRLISAAPTEPYNIRILHAWAGPLRAPGAASNTGILGVLRWPRERGETGIDFGVLKLLEPVNGFTIPPHSHDHWMVTLILRQRNLSESMRAEGTTIRYAIDLQEHTVSIPTALCFFTTTDSAACPDYED